MALTVFRPIFAILGLALYSTLSSTANQYVCKTHHFAAIVRLSPRQSATTRILPPTSSSVCSHFWCESDERVCDIVTIRGIFC